ncbi:ets DNA-binding protein pokkuri-like isoform X1 [Musca vetustissima]|uniref:ets DNA-binding protein pokkuri isoform X1 n=1 Tax=Musca vetustissima TaxID=27455 RepID=UPI002AB6AC52|nr:ets DNA-binding protein pokkuri isoform X1 [Musca vetustissima]XP_061392016.1 ets DNA-binding protein pokkuri-like isoform X1 [Musca vetustissima]
MKMLPVQLSLNPPLGLWSDMLWRCPPAPPSQLAELKTQLPPSLPSDPRLWSREDVAVFLHFCEREFDLPKVDYDLFQMNGKALCLLTRADFGHRCPGAGDVLHNVLQMLVIESHMMQWHLPNSPVTPTSRYPLSPHSHPPTPTWPPIGAPESAFHQTSHLAPHHFMPPNSVTLSPPPSVDSQASSPPQSHDQAQQQQQNGTSNSPSSSSSSSSSSAHNGNSSSSSSTSSTGSTSSASAQATAAAAAAAAALSASNAFSALKQQQHNATSASSHHSDSDEESYSEPPAANSTIVNFSAQSYQAAAAAAAAVAQYNNSPPTTPILKDMPQSLKQQIKNTFVNSWSQQQQQQQQQQHLNLEQQKLPNLGGGSVSAPTTPSYMQPVKREFFPDKSDNRYMQPVKREFFPENTEPNTNGRLLWDFLQQLLNDRNQKYSDLIAWKCRDTGVFKIVDPAGLAKLWGIQKNHLSMNYDKMSRALRYYYRVNILRKVQGERHCYQFLRNPTELKNIKNISLLRQSVGQTNGTNGSPGATNSNGSNSNVNQSPSSITNSPTSNGTNWAMPTQTPASQMQTPQRPSSQGNPNHLTLPNGISSAAAAVAAAAAAAYGPPPSSPLFMHAINGAFHYLSSNGVPPNSPAALPTTPNEKFQFNIMKNEPNAVSPHETSGPSSDEMKPTDLSVSGSVEKRPYSSPSANDDCYPLIRNADGLTTIKLIRYNENEGGAATQQQNSSLNDSNDNQQQQQQRNTPTPMDSESSEMESSPSHDSMGATDLRK